MGKQLNEVQIKALQDMFEASGAIAFGKKSILEYSQKARDILDQTELNDEAKQGISSRIRVNHWETELEIIIVNNRL